MPSLSVETVRLLRAGFDKDGHHPSDRMWQGLTDLANCLEQMADRVCEPSFYVSSLDPGVGKTQTVVQFLKALLASPQHEHVGVVIFFYTKQQIREVVERASLRRNDFAVLMSSEEDNEQEQELIDSGNPRPTAARVLFTTQQRLQLVSKSRSFADIEVYHFRGHPRQVRIWDEALLPATEVIVRAY